MRRAMGERAASGPWWAVVAASATLLAAPPAGAQQGQPRRTQQPIEIRGQVPTPQVVTVRPREQPEFGRQVLSPNFYDRTFWSAILPPYLLVPQRMIAGGGPLDTMTTQSAGAVAEPNTEYEAIRRELEARRARLDSISGRVRALGRPDSVRVPRDTTRRDPPPRPPAGDTPASRTPGTAPARSRR